MLATSCEVPIEVEGDSKIIVQSYFTGEQDLIVYVSESRLRSSGNAMEYVGNASVTLFTEDNYDFIEALIFQGDANPPYYKTVGFQAEVGKVYILNVDVPGFKPVTASNSIPEPVEIDTIYYSNLVTSNGGVSDVEFEVVVSIDDPGQFQNYYHLLFSQELLTTKMNDEGVSDIIQLNNGNELSIFSINKFVDIDQYFNHPSFLVNDAQFNGEKIDISFKGSYSYDPELYDRGEFTIELRTVSRAYYQHFQNLLSEPENPLSGGIDGVGTSNVTNGAGVFAGYSSRSKNPD